MADLYPQSPLAEKSESQLEDLARLWADELKHIPAKQIPDVYGETMRTATGDFLPTVGAFKSGWERIQARTPRETFQQQEARQLREKLTGSEIKALVEGNRPIPAPGRIFFGLGKVIACKCKYSCGRSRSAQLLPDGSRWVCELGECGFSLRANDEKAVRATAIEVQGGDSMKWHVAEPEAEPELKPEPKAELEVDEIEAEYQSPAHQLAEIYGMNLDVDFNPSQTAKWRAICLWLKNDFSDVREIFPTGSELWTAYDDYLKAREIEKAGAGGT